MTVSLSLGATVRPAPAKLEKAMHLKTAYRWFECGPLSSMVFPSGSWI